MSQTLNRTQALDCVHDIRAAVERLADEDYRIRSTLAELHAERGSPPSQLSGTRGGGSPADPVGRLVAHGDPVISDFNDALHIVDSALIEARKRLDQALARAASSKPPYTSAPAGTSLNAIWCSHHLRFGMKEPRGDPNRNMKKASDLCLYCYDHDKQHGKRPPRDLLEARARGDRMSAARILNRLSADP